jgi:hypothetical protein
MQDSGSGRKVRYSDSVEFTNGCVYYFFVLLLLCIFAPVLLCALIVWWFVAWILGLIFPGKEFFPIGKVLKWFSRVLKR